MTPKTRPRPRAASKASNAERDVLQAAGCCMVALNALQQGAPVGAPQVWAPLASALDYVTPLIPDRGKETGEIHPRNAPKAAAIIRRGKRPPEREVLNSIDCCVASLQSLQHGLPMTDLCSWVPLARVLGYLLPLVPADSETVGSSSCPNTGPGWGVPEPLTPLTLAEVRDVTRPGKG